MKLFKPSWISHDGKPIFSIDIHPDGSRLVTGGQGDGGSSGKVIVWNMKPIQDAEDEKNENVPKVLCVMDNHLACVNCVRWSCNGRYLASGGDDRLIMIWQFAGYGVAGGFGAMSNMKTSNGERWRCSHTLKGHTGDVLDLAWSPADQWLASCSIDNSVVIWNVEKFPEVTATLKGHTSLVKGVTWDPIGSYVASQSDDRTVKIWKTLDWKLEATITKPFVECTATTHILRLNWSPDGGYLVSAHAMNNSGPTAQIIEREGWKTNLDFVGHRKAITCTRFNGNVFRKPTATGDDPQQHVLPYTCCAVGSRDRTLSVWLTSLRRPLVVLHDLFKDSIVDISWSFSGYSLLCCSWDGTIAYVEFKPGEIGQTLSQKEKNDLHRETYGKTSCAGNKPLIIENPAMLAMQQRKMEENGAVDGDAASADGTDAGANKLLKSPQSYPTKQIETRTPSGRRRIIPVFVAPQEALGGIPKPFGSSGSAFGKSSLNLSNRQGEASVDSSPLKVLTNGCLDGAAEASSRDRIKSSTAPEEPGNATTAPAPVESDGGADAGNDEKERTLRDAAADVVAKLTANEEDATSKVAADSIKRSPVTPDDHVPQKKRAVLDIRLSEKTKKPTSDEKSDVRKKTCTVRTDSTPAAAASGRSADPPSQPRRPVGRPPLHVKRKHNMASTGAGAASPGGRKKHKQHVAAGDPASASHHAVTPHEVSASATKRQQQPTTRSPERHRLAPAKLCRKITAQSDGVAVTGENQLTADDKCPASASLHRVVCTTADDRKRERWSTVVSHPVVAISVSRHVAAVACWDNSMTILSLASGRRLIPLLFLPAAVSRLHARNYHVVVADVACSLSVWDVKRKRAVVSGKSFAHLLPATAVSDAATSSSPVATLRQLSLTEQGSPLLTLANGRTCTYCSELCSWVHVSRPDDALEQFSEHVAIATAGTMGDDRSSSDERGEHDVMLSFQSRPSHGMGGALHTFRNMATSSQRDATVAVFEHKIGACDLLRAPRAYRRCFLAYVRYLVNENLHVRLREVCDELMGPPTSLPPDAAATDDHPSAASAMCPSSWSPHKLGMEKRLLLRDHVLPIVGSNLSFQRFYTDYHDQLECVDTFDDDVMV